MIYLDNAATTKLYPEVIDAMIPYLVNNYSNPSSRYSFADQTKEAINKSRNIIANFIDCNPDEIYFTSGGTESDNWALKTIAENYKDKGKHIITSKIEHHAILNTCKWLETQGFEITYLDVDEFGFISLEELERTIRKDTILISIMFANNEIGTIQAVRAIGDVAHKHDVIFHTDAVQAYGHLKIDVRNYNIDMMSVSGHKINAPKGIGFLYVKSGIKISPLLHGGSQENGMRAGTYNVLGIVGLGAATEITHKELVNRYEKEQELQWYFITKLYEKIPEEKFKLNGSSIHRVPNNINISFKGIESNTLLLMLNEDGICASSGSACNSDSLEPSHVLKAIHVPDDYIYGTLRFTLSKDNTKEGIDIVIDKLVESLSILESLKKVKIDKSIFSEEFQKRIEDNDTFDEVVDKMKSFLMQPTV